MTTLILRHIDDTPNSTVSELMLKGERLCYIIEDGYRPVKVKGETRIPAGRYELYQRRSGGFFERYSKRFGHTFVTGFKNVPSFTWILFHIGNSISNTRGCLLSNTEYYLGSDGNYWGAGSTDAYKALHKAFEGLFELGPVFIQIDRGGGVAPKDPPVVFDDPKDPPVEPPLSGCGIETLRVATAVMFVIFLAISLLS